KLFKSKASVCFLSRRLSTSLPVACGVPQGSILGPLLFLVYVNDIVKVSDLLQFILFADDTNIVYSNRSIRQLMHIVNLELEKVADWFRANMLSLNVLKIHYILFGSKTVLLDEDGVPDFAIKIANNNIAQVSDCKFLGIILDKKTLLAKAYWLFSLK